MGSDVRRLTDKVILVTGAARGQGELEAEAVTREGGVAILCDVRADLGEGVARRLREHGRTAEFHHLDVTSPEDWARVCEAVRGRFGRIDALVNNAGVGHRVPLMETTLDAWNTIMAVNLTGAALGIQAVVPVMRQSGGGSIVNISSVAGLTAWPAVAYSVSKWGLRGLTKGAALELGPSDIRVNSIHPGVVDTEFVADAPGHFRDAYTSMSPLGREARPEEIVPVVVFLCSDESAYVSGAEIAIDGGFVAAGAAQGMVAMMHGAGEARMLVGSSSGLDTLRAARAGSADGT